MQITTQDIQQYRVHTDIADVLSPKQKILPKPYFSTEQLEYLHRVFPEATATTAEDKLRLIQGQRSVLLHIAAVIQEQSRG